MKVKGDKNKGSGSKKSSKKKEGKGEDDTDSEEERWLDAIESGKLEEVMEIFPCLIFTHVGCDDGQFCIIQYLIHHQTMEIIHIFTLSEKYSSTSTS